MESGAFCVRNASGATLFVLCQVDLQSGDPVRETHGRAAEHVSVLEAWASPDFMWTHGGTVEASMHTEPDHRLSL